LIKDRVKIPAFAGMTTRVFLMELSTPLPLPLAKKCLYDTNYRFPKLGKNYKQIISINHLSYG